MTKTVRSLLFVFVLASLVLAACGGGTSATQAPSSDAPAATSAPQQGGGSDAPMPVDLPIVLPEMPAPADVTGDIITAGSSTVFPLSERMAELFQQEGYNGNITVDSIGSGAGFERFCKTGETDIANASRPIRQAEIDNCAAIGRTPLEFRVGTDALAVVINPNNDFASSLTIEQLGKIFAGQAKLWSEVDPSFPAEPIKVYSPGADSGTFDYFIEAVVSTVTLNAEGKADVALGEEALLGLEGAQFSEDDNVLVQGVEGDQYAIGYFGFAYYNENRGALKAVNVNGIEPNQADVDNGTYPLARPLFIYSDASIMQDKPQVAAFIGFYLSTVNDEILDVGYFPAPAKALYSSWGAWYASVK
jgi:phosphate binding protein